MLWESSGNNFQFITSHIYLLLYMMAFLCVTKSSISPDISAIWPVTRSEQIRWNGGGGGKGSYNLLKWHLSLVQLFIKYELFISWQLDIFCMDYNAQIIYGKWKPIFNLKQWWCNTNSQCISLCQPTSRLKIPLKNMKYPFRWFLSRSLTDQIWVMNPDSWA